MQMDTFLEHLHALQLKNSLVALLPVEPDDFEALYQVASDPLIWELHPVKDRHQREVFAQFFEGAIASKSSYKIIDSQTGKIIGSTRFYEYKEEERSIGIGYTFLARAYWGGKYNSALKALMLDYIFQYVDTVLFHVGAVNLRSQKAVLKLGAVIVAEMEMEFSGKRSLYHEYALSKVVWQNSSRGFKPLKS